MGFLDTVIGGLMGGGAGSSPFAGVLMNLLGGQGGGFGSQQMLMQDQGVGGGGGIGGLLASFENAGLGHVAQSWVGGGPNQPILPQQLQSVFGANQVQGMASQAGMEPQDFLSQLSQHLPRAVDAMTPNGQMPEQDTMSV